MWPKVKAFSTDAEGWVRFVGYVEFTESGEASVPPTIGNPIGIEKVSFEGEVERFEAMLAVGEVEWASAGEA